MRKSLICIMSVQYARRHRESSGSFAMCLRGFLVCLFDFVCVCVFFFVGVCVCVFCFVLFLFRLLFRNSKCLLKVLLKTYISHITCLLLLSLLSIVWISYRSFNEYHYIYYNINTSNLNVFVHHLYDIKALLLSRPRY